MPGCQYDKAIKMSIKTTATACTPTRKRMILLRVAGETRELPMVTTPTISSGGTENLYVGKTVGTMISNGGYQDVYSGGTASGKLREPVLRLNNVYGILRAVENGVGLAAFPDYMAQESSKIVQILQDLEGPIYETYFVYPEEMRNSKRIAVFRDFLLRKVAETRF